MKTNAFTLWLLGVLLAGSANAALTTNSWLGFSGKWEDGAHWDAGVPSSSNAVNVLSNVLSGTVITTNGCGAKLYVGDTGVGTLTIAGGTWVANDVAVAGSNDGASRGTLTIAGGTNRFRFLSTGNQVNSTGAVWMTGGQL